MPIWIKSSLGVTCVKSLSPFIPRPKVLVSRQWGDSAYTGQRKILREKAPKATDFTHRKGSRNHPLTDEDRARNKTKSKVRAKFEHPFLILKKIFGFRKARYRGIDKNANRLFVVCGLVNPYMVQRQLLRLT